MALLTPPKLPGALPLLGHALEFQRAPLDFVRRGRDLGAVVEFRLGRGPAYLVTTPAAVRELLGKHGQHTANGVLFEKLQILGGNGIGSVYGPPHRERRKLLAPMFNQVRVAAYAEIVHAVATEKAASWRPGPMDLNRELHEIAGTIIMRSLFSGAGGIEAAARAAHDLPVVFSGVAKRAYAPVSFQFRLPTKENRAFATATRRLHALIDSIIEQARGRDRDDMLSALLAEPLTPAQVHDEVMTLFFVGTEASAAAFGWIFHLLETHPAAMERVSEEVRGVDGPDGIEKLDYLRRVVHESLRLYPPGWLFPRIPDRDLDLAGYRVPAGVNVFFSPYAVHRDPANFPEPDTFDPDRWLGPVPRDAYLPFGAGARGCLGGSFAFQEIMVVAAAVLKRWQLTGAGRPRPHAATVLGVDRLPVVLSGPLSPVAPER